MRSNFRPSTRFMAHLLRIGIPFCEKVFISVRQRTEEHTVRSQLLCMIKLSPFHFAIGHGLYFALGKQSALKFLKMVWLLLLAGEISLGQYAQPTTVTWKNSEFPASRIAALCEIVNAPKQFVSSSPYLVVNKVEWIQTRYLLVQAPSQHGISQDETITQHGVQTVSLDPKVWIFSLNVHKQSWPRSSTLSRSVTRLWPFLIWCQNWSVSIRES